MTDLYRFGVSLEKSLIDAFDKHISARRYKNRSEAIRDLIREELTRKKMIEGGVVAGAVVMTYDHHKRELVNTLLDIQHDFQSLIISTQHVHLDHHHCLEIIAVKGRAREIERLADSIKAQVGVKQVSVSVATTEG
ncbi:MAG: nickel-responsive transcriptional regulator NikR [Chitinispirillaceae bacterium]|nr:nickel-responsive transcriptional regulator NikR [Chitinispirillaceae bacterium]